MLDPLPSNDPTTEKVTVKFLDGEWHVCVYEDGAETVETFAVESFALSFAEGQRTRLGLVNNKSAEADF